MPLFILRNRICGRYETYLNRVSDSKRSHPKRTNTNITPVPY
jgi:hypothetical protein